MDKTIVTALLVVAGVISAVFLFNSIYPTLVEGSQAMSVMERRIDERMKSQIEIIHVAKVGNNVMIWVKNVGSLRVLGVESADLFFGPQGNYSRVPYGAGSPNWTYTFENDTAWNPSATVKITVAFSSTPAAGTYYAKMVVPNGVSDDYLVSW